MRQNARCEILAHCADDNILQELYGNEYMVASSILGSKRKCSELEKEKVQDAKKIKIEK